MHHKELLNIVLNDYEVRDIINPPDFAFQQQPVTAIAFHQQATAVGDTEASQTLRPGHPHALSLVEAILCRYQATML